MPRKGSPQRYADAIFGIAQDANNIAGWTVNLEILVTVLQNTEFLDFLESPKVKEDDKMTAIQEVLSQEDALLRNLMSLLTVRTDLRIAAAILQQYRVAADEALGQETAEVTTAVELRDEEKEKLTQALSSLIGKSVNLNLNVDPEVVGGFRARVGDKLIDGTLKSRFERLRQEIGTN
jgi:F-type H+-transporting ATPase subunit delta